MKRIRRIFRLAAGACLLLAAGAAAGSPNAFRTLVVVNTNSPDSVELGTYYAEQHGIPAHHICSLGIATNLVSAGSNQFHSLLRTPVTNHIAAENLDSQIDFVVLCGAFPTRVETVEGVSASLFYGFQNAPGYNEGGIGCNLPDFTSNAYFRAERAFRSADGWNDTNGFIAFHLIASNLPVAKLVADRGAAAQSTFPPSSFNLHILGSIGRSVREARFAHTRFSFTALPGLVPRCLLGPYLQYLSGSTNAMGYHDGFGNIPAICRTNNIWLPGAYADHMTSCGGMIPDPCDNQSTVLDWMEIGATASYGTVDEPCNYLEKYPDPLMAFWYARGFTIGEAYAMSLDAPYQGLLAGDPLAAPFAAGPLITVTSPVPWQIVTGSIPVQVSAGAHPQGGPAAALDLYLDGRWQAALTNLAPTPGNELSVVVGDRTNTVAVSPGDTLCDAVSNLAEAVNADAACVASARAWGDRLELVYKHFDLAGDHVPVSAFAATGSASVLTLGTGLAATNLHPSTYFARKRLFLFAHTNGMSTNVANAGDTITLAITLTNGVAVTNQFVATAGQTITSLIEQIQFAINTNPVLKANSGVRFTYLANGIGNVLNDGTLLARTAGPRGGTNRVDYTVTPVTTNYGLRTNFNFSGFMDDNPDDVRPRANLLFHVKPGSGDLEAAASLDTTVLDDGIHVLDVIARDGSAVAAASRLTLPLAVANTSLALRVSSAHGSGSPPAGVFIHPPGAVLTNSISVPASSNGTQLVCTGWAMTGNEPLSGSATNFTMTLTNHAELTWLWTTNYWLDTEAGEHGAVNVPDSWQPGGVSTQITALPDAYYGLAEWTGDASGTNNPLDLLMDAPQTVQATFTALLATNGTPQWWLAGHGWTNDFDAAATNDVDEDGRFTWQEYVADTDPTNAASFLHPLSTTGTVDSLVIGFDPTSTGRHYWIDATALIEAPDWANLTNAPGTGGAWQPEWIPPATGLHFYRGRVSLPP
ncbi:MAG TPA: TIGR03790 family protein [Kiritimatiellia bacterium]|nr:TIGR03790 family protein [Kiritimatiellia bacterium]